jgi:signal transduction histidine kinase/CheY-like chemotaxis protein
MMTPVAPAEPKILIVDDDSRNIMVLEALLSDLGTQLVSARSGEEALRKLLDSEFAVVLLDVQMPGMDGFETARLIRERESSSATPIIFLTAINADIANVLRGYSVGAVDFITKPIEKEILRSKVQVFIDLFRKTEEVRRQAEQLRRLEQRAHEQELALQKARQAEELALINERLSVMTGAMTTYLEEASWPRAAAVLIDGAIDVSRSKAGFIATLEPDGSVRAWAHRSWDPLLGGLADVNEVPPDGWKLSGPTADAIREIVQHGAVVSAAQARDHERLGQLLRGLPEIDDVVAMPVSGREAAVGLLALAGSILSEAEVAVCATVMAKTASVLFESHSRSRREAQLSDQLRQAQKMEAIGNLAGGIAHDFNNLLTVIHGYVGFLLQGLADDDPHRENAQAIQEAATQAATLTRQLLAFSRKQVLQPRVFELNVLAGQTQKMLRRLIGEHIQLETRFDAGAGRVKADPAQVEQVLMNLAVNARDAMPSGGRLVISTRPVDIRRGDAGGLRAGPYALLTVEDNGVGMDEATRSRAFEPFFTTKEVGKGTGLGLATVYGIVQQSGGHIDVRSEAGKGATFRIWFPRVEEQVAAPPAQPTAPPPRGEEHEIVLLVEDERPVRTLARRILEQSGYTVLEADSGEKALRLCEDTRGPIHLLLTDMVMPGMNGRELARQVADRRPDIRILYMSGYIDEMIGAITPHERETCFLEKPFSPDAMVRKVRDLLDAPAEAPAKAASAGK